MKTPETTVMISLKTIFSVFQKAQGISTFLLFLPCSLSFSYQKQLLVNVLSKIQSSVC